MREALLIFRKDVRHLWPVIAMVLAIVALESAFDGATAAVLQAALLWLWVFSCVYLAASAIHEESLPGDNQYWLTRPIVRSRLLLAKLCFLAVFAAAPRV